ncbi:MAG TPA: NAD(P)/FAD-dependent oxidoreductase [Candidatus Sumerlaeota bacterium]|nr:MAG: hypothetical protein BWY12_01010 [candidate division BRC1 bacterium ADurb.Bin183]HOE63414.1 NAD(P)/FAD-dependent oxidoreductase [Candidatus Sumerlaeota bacterium]HRR30280.1 NAD(P)/FAD-dependent oxidoreductase [Candidatus Sumerlaeia bacterium]HON50893.1 NAD(P)/FAD-dependent oxidoreductase [Candidatus Sumerlaeota bacterium]HOR65587.1 NAD(P)/FAD-dependent oxidoreductase [Candidatus Sumerlaeota bacterium]
MIKKAIIIGAGPAGLTAAYELVQKTKILPIVIEKSQFMGGISRTVNYKGNRIDIGGHRFFSKSDRVMEWWQEVMPLEKDSARIEEMEKILLLRDRKSRIYCFRKFFDYPITLSGRTIANLGAWRTFKIGMSYLKSSCFPIRNPKNLEEFFINRFGKELYLTFFKSYTEKVWGKPCKEISAEWGAQRVKGLSVWKSIVHVLKRVFKKSDNIAGKDTETSLIEKFLYPKYGPGQMWEEVARIVRERGGEIITGLEVENIEASENRIVSVSARDSEGNVRRFDGDYFFSTMPIKDFISGMGHGVPENVREISDGLTYRDFITVGLLVNQLKIKPANPLQNKLINDTWIYIQEPDVDVGRLQIFNNWSPYLVADPSKVWLGLEYFCQDTDALWKKPDSEMIEQGAVELDRIGIINKRDVLDGTVIRMPKTYPGYFGTFDRFSEVRRYLDGFENLFLIGRNGMHRYNNQDHSMLTAMEAVQNIISGRTNKENIWSVNTEQEYHETKDKR